MVARRAGVRALRRSVLLTGLLTLIALTSHHVLADGGVLQVDQRVAGREILVYTTRGPFVAGINIDISVLVEYSPSGQLVPDATVTIHAEEEAKSKTILAFPATHGAAVNKAYYAAGMHLPAGRWNIVTEVRDGDWTGQVAFPLSVVAASGTGNSPAISDTTMTRIASGFLLVWVGWFVIRARQEFSHQGRES